jgi:hypothetical protein
MTLRLLVIAPLVTLVASCASLGPSGCPGGSQAMVNESLYFGTEKPNGAVTAAEWQAFLNDYVTPRFPAGLSVWQAAGQWKSSAGPIVREPSYVLNIVHAGTATAQAALDAIAGEYKRKFGQEAVLRVRTAACVSF